MTPCSVRWQELLWISLWRPSAIAMGDLETAQQSRTPDEFGWQGSVDA
jgi:hypothetical protein